MVSAAYSRWDRTGRQWEPARPISELEAWAHRNGFTVLGTIGNDDHLYASPPEDHTPFSATAWPLPLTDYIVCAIDIADERGLGAAILAGARAGKYPWLKYINTGQKHYDCRDGFRTWKYNPDTHNHLSIRTDFINASIGDFDPLGDDMNSNDRQKLNAIINMSPVMTLDIETPGEDGTGAKQDFPVPFVVELKQLAATVDQLKTGGVDIAALAEALAPLLPKPPTAAEVAAAYGDLQAAADRAAANVLDGPG